MFLVTFQLEGGMTLHIPKGSALGAMLCMYCRGRRNSSSVGQKVGISVRLVETSRGDRGTSDRRDFTGLSGSLSLKVIPPTVRK